MRVLILGKNGQVGQAAVKALSSHFEVIALGRVDKGGDLLDVPALVETIKAYLPDVIINAAAYTAVDAAQNDEETAFQVNARAPQALAQVAKDINAFFVHLSTDYVFDGVRSTPYDEMDATHPLNVYGQSKLEGERLVLDVNPEALILRLTWVHAPGHTNFVTSLIRWFSEKEKLCVVNDQWGTPTSATEVARGLGAVLSEFDKGKVFDRGIYHFANAGFCHRHECAQWVKKVLVQAQRLSPDVEIEAVKSDVFPTPAKRPSHVVLNTNKFQTTFGFTPRTWQEGVTETVFELIKK